MSRETSMMFSVITPVFNGEKYIADTMTSVLAQSAIVGRRASLQYILCDGGSSDATVKIAEQLGGGLVTICSAPDRGMYDALAKGLRLVEGNFVTYINAGDLLFPWAFDVVADVMQANRFINWLCGWAAICNEESQVTNVKLPYRYRRRLIERGAYGRILPWMQQEGIFWRSHLNALIDLEALARLRLAGDYFLWRSFAKEFDIHIVQALMGVFRKHEGQLSSAIDRYRSEMAQQATRLGPLDFVTAAWDNLMWWMPPPVKKALNPRGQLAFDYALKRWR
jgi:glycosyltransferase involved in cell wall biosynthesis